MPFACSICGEESTRICVRCTKDSCDNHLCEKCSKCSDCCECEVRLSAPAVVSRIVVTEVVREVEPEVAETEIVEPEIVEPPSQLESAPPLSSE